MCNKFVLGVTLLVLGLIAVPVMAAQKEHCEPSGIYAAQFFSDNDRVAFKHCCSYWYNKTQPCLWSVYELSTKKLYEFTPLNKATLHRLKHDVAFSRDGKQIAFVSGEDHHRNIFIMNADGGNVQQLTHDYNENPQDAGNGLIRMIYNEKPSFSPDGKRIIFVRSQTKRRQPLSSGHSIRPSRWDIYEMEIATVKERKLTDYASYAISAPQYLSDGKRFVFSANHLLSAQKAESGINDKKIGEYMNKYRVNTIFIMDGENNALKPILINGWHSDEPRVLSGDAILFQSQVNEKGNEVWMGQNFVIAGTSPPFSPFIYKEGNIKRISYEHVDHYSTSPDGTRAVLEMSGGGLQVRDAEVALLTEIKVTSPDEWWHYFRRKRQEQTMCINCDNKGEFRR
jgi:dipeptidyl aminopeptidase/acylaminoacyl peptidase